ncbi:NADP-dependent oxidoreductase [Microbacterium terregens]|uniref:NADP-dependent oxidoreductase n=1 Tax=Microbacterium terregens TaxID=69363 RepID=A0ABV5SYZ0_9MICO
MMAVQIHAPTGIEAIRVVQVPDPVPARDGVLVAVEAATINPVDLLVVSGGAIDRMPAGRPWTPGWDLAGIVTAVGDDVDPALEGQRVLGFSQWFRSGQGTQASRVALPADAIALSSGAHEPAELTTFGLNGLTALQALDAADLPSGSALLVTGATGAVGAFVTQLAEHRGIEVVTVGRATDHAAFRAIRADAVVNCAPVNQTVLDGVRDGGTAISVTRPFTAVRGIRSERIGVRHDPSGLRAVTGLAELGILRSHVRRTFPARQAADAYRDLQQSASRGRVVLTF